MLAYNTYAPHSLLYLMSIHELYKHNIMYGPRCDLVNAYTKYIWSLSHNDHKIRATCLLEALLLSLGIKLVLLVYLSYTLLCYLTLLYRPQSI